MKITQCDHIKGTSDYMITVITTKRSWFGLGKPYTTIKRYRGRSTVWRDADTGKRQSTSMELWLCDVYKKAQWDK